MFISKTKKVKIDDLKLIQEIIKITSTGEKNKGRIINEITRRECLMKYKINKQ